MVRELNKSAVRDSIITEHREFIEVAWGDADLSAEAVELTDEQKIILDKRLEAYHRNPNEGAPWEVVKKRILNRK
jgi:putative addiction module component (TIGR02574 family)